jgi:hypothetical protein
VQLWYQSTSAPLFLVCRSTTFYPVSLLPLPQLLLFSYSLAAEGINHWKAPKDKLLTSEVGNDLKVRIDFHYCITFWNSRDCVMKQTDTWNVTRSAALEGKDRLKNQCFACCGFFFGGTNGWSSKLIYFPGQGAICEVKLLSFLWSVHVTHGSSPTFFPF